MRQTLKEKYSKNKKTKEKFKLKERTKTIKRKELAIKPTAEIKEIPKERLEVNYKDLCDIEAYKKAYEKIKSKPGNMTPGTDGDTFDGMSLTRIEKLVGKVRSGEFDFKPSKRIYIKKPNGKMRPLGIPSPTDKIVQKVYLELLEKAFEPTFLDSSHGFRPNRSCHTALKEIKKWTGCTWLIEGDIKGYFDHIDHHILETLLEKRIKDRRLIHMYWKMARAGYIENDGKEYASTLGVPQGSIISPILSNIYLHELDVYMQKLKSEYDTKSISIDNPEYARERHKLNVQVKKGKTITGEVITQTWINAEKKRINKLPSVIRNGIKVTYVRYADDFVVGVKGERTVAVEIKKKIKKFLEEELKVELNEEKTKITQLTRDTGLFLGYRIKVTDRKYYESKKIPNNLINSTGEQKVIPKGMTTYSETRRAAYGRVKLYIPQEDIINKLVERGYAKKIHALNTIRGKAYGLWIAQSDAAIIALYRSIILGYANFYNLADDYYRLSGIIYILKFSAVHTIAAKHRSSITEVFEKYGKDLRINKKTQRPPTKKDSEKDIISLKINTTKEGKQDRVGKGELNIEPLRVQSYVMKTAFILDEKQCKACGSTESVEMHHVRALKDLDKKKDTVSKLMIAMRRKQVPLCKKCHQKVHLGKYDAEKL